MSRHGPSPTFAPRSIVVAQLASIGDMVFTTPLIDELVARWPEADLAVVGRPTAIEVLWDREARLSLIPYAKDGADRGLTGVLRVARAVRRRRPDVFLGVTRSERTAFLAACSRAANRVGFRGVGGGLAYNRLVERGGAARPLPARPSALLEALGVTPAPRTMRVVVGSERRAAAERALRAAGWRGGPLLAVAPGAHFATKRWPAEHVGRLLDLASAGGELQPALFGGPAETELIAQLLLGRPGVLDRRGIGVGGLAAELTLAAVFVSGDSGPAHIARAVGAPTVILAGPTDPALLSDGRPFIALSRGLPCQPCSPRGDAQCPLGHHACLAGLPAEEVFAAARRAQGGGST